MIRIPRKSILGAAAVAAIAITAACGGSDDDGSDSDASEVTVESYIAQADEICTTYDAQFDQLAEPSNAQELRTFIEGVLRIGQAQTAELEALEVPDEIAELEAQARENNAEAVEALEAGLQRLEDGDDAADVIADLTAESERLEMANQEISEEIGLEVCGNDDTDGTTTTGEETEPAPETEPDTRTEPDANAALQYVSDVDAAATSLNAIGEAFEASDPEALQDQASGVEQSVSDFNAAVDSMAGYTLDDAQLEEQRQAFVSAGEDLEGPLNELSAAVADGDVTAIGEIITDLAPAAVQFQEAAAQIS